MSKPSDPTVAQVGHQNQPIFDAATFEQSNVHSVYEAIAPHFSDTRYKPWPLIPAFINSLPVGSIGADLGCGNGKYLHLRNILASAQEDTSNDIMMLGMDRSSNLIDLAHHNFGSILSPDPIDEAKRNEVAVGDAMHSNFRSGCFDFSISIATIHHFASFQRRIEAVAEMIRIVRPCQANKKEPNPITINEGPYAGLRSGSGRFLIVVWALEQRGQSRRQFEQVASSEDQSKSHQGQDLMVPWILKNASKQNGKQAIPEKEATDDPSSPEIFQRFYHVFEQGELEKTVDEAAKLYPDLIIEHELGGWEKGNWYGIWRCIKR
ncbi:S-adenosyl-L-methionine-dependent methyltransferase [Meira miltonrushii]|uniref:S-adenosyl-L-methionine-dependent methyltransferase n=1 Tax=Meira miltonrushii TaxID=1280837 RepID=A0A316VC61_9BASI|nr:S-adenosyl-L-methionine-dependent methyltransferase [Meira miltonrushii]PWN33843.1 S-adenosyl-L-methionine-dependent methyltransferase [Meira miltonrushii]